jgi:hypothetical protein
MDAATFNDYLENRYYNQLKYYSDAAKKNQQRYKYFQWLLIVLSTATTILAALPKSDKFDIQYIIVATAAAVTILTSGLKTFQYQELWANYRSTIEQLKPEIYYYKFGVGDYGADGVDKESTFVNRVEQILNKEHDVWPVAKKLKDQANQGQQLNEEEQNKLDQQLRERFNTQKAKTTAEPTDTENPAVPTDTDVPAVAEDADVTEKTTPTDRADVPV